jgi:hypothetical protein
VVGDGRMRYWTNEVGDRRNWDGIKRVTMIIKWTELFDPGRVECGNCHKLFKWAKDLRKHWRRYDDCLDYVERLMIEHPAGRDDV